LIGTANPSLGFYFQRNPWRQRIGDRCSSQMWLDVRAEERWMDQLG
jgi:hypothetical protein